ncbi:hypothetical protein MGMO_61c00460 [Methyloglobulus morosus KoM1]|uniref:Glycine zipper 2TM domain-containing protein n=1 Tax=Methyloglobulus morosus KoM1 TaxID=1116472 RepID=V5BGA6_9GAMM|nr:hypothetical protein [Methyloglobulus morosus]ESS72335.1 hypothetical protein MGMO_61c00460 [Methyloglobulus morosus KoM1]
MKKLIYFKLAIVALLFSSSGFADDHGGHHGGWGGHGHHGWGHRHQGWGGYGHPRQQINNYYQQPPVVYQQQPQYYPPQPQYYNGGGYYDNRSHQGLAGGVVGTVFGYELGNGNPLAAGLGAAAGSFLGNGVGWRY